MEKDESISTIMVEVILNPITWIIVVLSFLFGYDLSDGSFDVPGYLVDQIKLFVGI